MVYLPTFTIKISQMWVNISYINLMRHRVPLDDFQLILNYEIMCVD